MACKSLNALGLQALATTGGGGLRCCGKLLLSRASAQGWAYTAHIYLGDRLIAEQPSNGAAQYIHSDALGSPVARTSPAAAVLTRTRYEPYGATVAGSTNPNGIGFTGHVNDPDTGLVYMQQRYYEPIAGRFLSVDPITTDVQTGRKFNRYVYGANNPYRFVDPDGLDEIDLLGGPQVGFGDACKAMCNNVKRNFVQIVVCVVCLANDKRPPPPPPKPPVPQKPVPGPKPPGDPKPPGPPGPEPAPPPPQPGPGGPQPPPGPSPGGTPSPTPQPGPAAPPPPPPPPPKPELPK
jgi:RHS repeat-associated protein